MDELQRKIQDIEARGLARNAAAREAEAVRLADVEERRRVLRDSMPVVASVVDAFKAQFGAGCKVLRAEEGGRVVVTPAYSKMMQEAERCEVTRARWRASGKERY